MKECNIVQRNAFMTSAMHIVNRPIMLPTVTCRQLCQDFDPQPKMANISKIVKVGFMDQLTFHCSAGYHGRLTSDSFNQLH